MGSSYHSDLPQNCGSYLCHVCLQCLVASGQKYDNSTLEDETCVLPETSLTNQVSPCNITEQWKPQIHSSGRLKKKATLYAKTSIPFWQLAYNKGEILIILRYDVIKNNDERNKITFLIRSTFPVIVVTVDRV